MSHIYFYLKSLLYASNFLQLAKAPDMQIPTDGPGSACKISASDLDGLPPFRRFFAAAEP